MSQIAFLLNELYLESPPSPPLFSKSINEKSMKIKQNLFIDFYINNDIKHLIKENNGRFLVNHLI